MQTRMWKPLRAEAKIFGKSKLGIVCAVIGCLIAMIFLGMLLCVGGALPGYLMGDFLSKTLHDGKAQRWLGWYFPKFAKTLMPSSSIKSFF